MPHPTPDTWEQGDPYERYVGRWSRRVAPLFLAWLGVPARRRWLDVGCGTGALCAAILEGCSPAAVVGVEPSEGFREAARARLAGRVELYPGSGAAIPLADESVDAVVSGLVLNFVPDAPAALAEMVRVTAPDGVVGAYVWDYAGGMELIRLFWDCVLSLDPAAAPLDEAARFPLCAPDALADLFAGARLQELRKTALEVPTPFASFDDYWEPFLGGQGPAPGYVASLEDDARARLRERLRERLPAAADGSITLKARAWAVRGIAS
ncbi:Demethylmenaquinone methyltransferase [Calidithermus terrae]|uniref:Demethylmenaquinone methyltransferase n=1 Tax=Calidithermus terrae TaxID=1408545 RepID=A0A399F329_9DEIN|nr:class I SAM-dependent methyltransferase [Calidithermus terrae]RIH90503.1 Demethylmenaquinone methyltransferase [Calidithermus terrae]